VLIDLEDVVEIASYAGRFRRRVVGVGEFDAGDRIGKLEQGLLEPVGNLMLGLVEPCVRDRQAQRCRETVGERDLAGRERVWSFVVVEEEDALNGVANDEWRHHHGSHIVRSLDLRIRARVREGVVDGHRLAGSSRERSERYLLVAEGAAY